MRDTSYVVDYDEAFKNVVAELKAHEPHDAVFSAIFTPAATAVMDSLFKETVSVHYCTLSAGRDEKLLDDVKKRSPLYNLKLNDFANRYIER